jgi:hypothetical protein
MGRLKLCGIVTLVILSAGCGALAPLQRLIQPPSFSEADGMPAELRLMTPSSSNPLGGAGVTLWLEVTNPNPFGFTLSTLQTTLRLEGSRAATGDFPLGLPLSAGQTTVVPVDLSISFADIPGLAGAIRQATAGLPLAYELEGTVGVDAGRFGQPTFGPMRLVTGELRAAALPRR